MKRNFLLTVIAGLMFAFASCGGEENKDENTDSGSTEISSDEKSPSSDDASASSSGKSAAGNFGLEEGMIKYKMNVMIAEVDMTTYFKDNGAVQASVMEAEMMGQKTKERELRKNGDYYRLNLLEKTGDKIITDGSDAEFDPMDMDFSNLSEEMKAEYKIKEVGEEDFLGKNCKVFTMETEGATSKVWIWKNIPLKMSVDAQGMSMDVLTALEINESPEFPEGIFEVPEDFKITEVKAEDLKNGQGF